MVRHARYDYSLECEIKGNQSGNLNHECNFNYLEIIWSRILFADDLLSLWN